MTRLSAPVLEEVLADADWLLFGIDHRALAAHFVRVPEDDLDDFVFIAHVPESRPRAIFDLARVLAACGPAVPTPAGPRMILHTAFCCSTLMARCLDEPGHSRVLRELPVFSGLPALRETLRAKGGGSPAWPTLVAAIDALSSRTLRSGAVVVNKPGNVVLPVAADLVAAAPAARLLLMHAGLRAFLRSALKKQAAGNAPWLQMYAALDPARGYAGARWVHDAAGLLELVCVVWNLQMALVRELGAHAGQMRHLEASTFLEAPEDAVRQARAWLQLPGPGDAPARAAARELARHAKQPGRTYSHVARVDEAARVEHHFGPAIGAVLAWNDRHFGPHGDVHQAAIAALPALGSDPVGAKPAAFA